MWCSIAPTLPAHPHDARRKLSGGISFHPADGLAVDADGPADLGVADAELDAADHFCPPRRGHPLRLFADGPGAGNFVSVSIVDGGARGLAGALAGLGCGARWAISWTSTQFSRASTRCSRRQSRFRVSGAGCRRQEGYQPLAIPLAMLGSCYHAAAGRPPAGPHHDAVRRSAD